MFDLIITKASGDTAVFDKAKLEKSMRNSGATEEQIDSVVKEIEPHLYSGISTKKIYRMAFSSLRKMSKNVAGRYQLKRAIMEIGPSGFLFEKFIGEVFKKQGYHTKISTIVQGKCITHEIDVIASTDKEHLMIECKFHSEPGKQSDVKVPLYIQSRFIDVHSQWLLQPALKHKSIQAWVITNTRFSPDAVQYGVCIGLHLLSWDYPLHKGLKDLVDLYLIYPITCLTSITKLEKENLLKENLLLCQELIENRNVLRSIGISDKRISSIIDEAKGMLKAK